MGNLEVIQNIVQASRDNAKKAKAQMELNLSRDVKDKKSVSTQWIDHKMGTVGAKSLPLEEKIIFETT